MVVNGYELITRPVAFSPDGHWLATSWTDVQLRLWPLFGGSSEEVRVLEVPRRLDAVKLVFDPRGRYLLATGPISGVAISADLRWVASSGDDGTLRLWPMPDLAKPPLHTLAHAGLVAKLQSLTNLRAVRDPEAAGGWKIEVGPFPGWAAAGVVSRTGFVVALADRVVGVTPLRHRSGPKAASLRGARETWLLGRGRAIPGPIDGASTALPRPGWSSSPCAPRPPSADGRGPGFGGESQRPSKRSSARGVRRTATLARRPPSPARPAEREPSPGIPLPEPRRDVRTGSGRTAASTWNLNESALSIGGESEDRADVLRLEVRKVSEDLLLAHAGSEVVEHVVDRDPQTADTGFAASLPGLDRDASLIVDAHPAPDHSADVTPVQPGSSPLTRGPWRPLGPIELLMRVPQPSSRSAPGFASLASGRVEPPTW